MTTKPSKPSKPRCSDERPCIPCYTGKGPCEAPEWDGEELPMVGVECEVLGTPTGSWSVGVIDYIDAKHCIWHWADGSGETMYNRVGNMKFRPIRSEEEMAADEMGRIVEGDTPGFPTVDTIMRRLYRAGYRKVQP